MFTKDAALKMGDGHTEILEELSHLALAPAGGYHDPARKVVMVATKPNADSTAQVIAFQTSVGECICLRGLGGSEVKCSPQAKLLLAGGIGFVYAGQCGGVPVETEKGAECFLVAGNSPAAELISIRLASMHLACVNGVWFLVD